MFCKSLQPSRSTLPWLQCCAACTALRATSHVQYTVHSSSTGTMQLSSMHRARVVCTCRAHVQTVFDLVVYIFSGHYIHVPYTSIPVCNNKLFCASEHVLQALRVQLIMTITTRSKAVDISLARNAFLPIARIHDRSRSTSTPTNSYAVLSTRTLTKS